MGSPRQFDFLREELQGECDVITPWLPGHGGNALDFARSGMKEWERAAEDALRDAFGCYEQVILLGHSMGGLLLADACKAFPEPLGLICVAMPLRIHYMPYAACNALKVALTAIPCKAREMCGVSPRPFLASFLWLPRYLELFRKAKRVRKRLNGLSMPMQCFYFKKDELCALASIRDLPEGIPVDICPHSRHSEWTEETCHRIAYAVKRMIERGNSNDL